MSVCFFFLHLGRWHVQRGVACIPKSVTPSRIQENLQVFDFSLSSDDMKLISSFNRNERFIVPTVEVRRRPSLEIVLDSLATPHG